MKTNKEVETEFLAELRALLAKYNTPTETAYIDVEETRRCFAKMVVNIPPIYDTNFNCVRERTEIDLGTMFDSR